MEASWFREHRFLCLSLLVVLLGLLMLEAARRADHFPAQVDQVTVDGARACIYLTYTDDAGMAQTAEITVDALPGQSFRGVVTEIGGVGANSGGSSKYDVELTLDRSPDMLEGMNTSVVVYKDSITGLLIPAAALNNIGSRTFVYTACDAKTKQLSAPVDVITGSSDGNLVEIVSGLTEGQTVWYAYYDSLSADPVHPS